MTQDSPKDASETSSRFKFKTHQFDRRGRLTAVDNYRLFIREGARLMERPVGSGNLWHESGTPAGRVEFELMPDGTERKTFKLKEPHIEYVAKPINPENASGESELRAKALEDELAAIKAERDALVAKAQEAREEAKRNAPAGRAAESQAMPQSSQNEVVASSSAPKPISNYGELI